MTKKKDKTKNESKFDLTIALSTVHPYLLDGFKEYIKDEKITSQEQFDKLYNEYKEFR